MSKEVSKAKKPADLGLPIGLFAKTLIVFIISQLIAAFLVQLVIAIFYRGPSQDIFDHSIGAQFFFVLIAEILAVASVWYLLKLKELDFGAIGLGRRPNKSDITWATKGYVATFGLVLVSSMLISWLVPQVNLDQKQNLGFNNLHGPLDNMLAFVALVILPPLGEEILMRGYLFSGLRRYWGFIWSLLATSVLFGLAHLEIGNGGPLVWAAAIETLLLSTVLCYLREKTGVLYAGILVHMFNNVLAFIVTYR